MSPFTKPTASIFGAAPIAWRGNCACGHWVVLLQHHTAANPYVCAGKCHAGEQCGRLHFWAAGTVVHSEAT